jgi:hypothetical protein
LLIGACCAVLVTAARAEQEGDAARRLDELWRARATDPSLTATLEYGRAVMEGEPDNFEAAWRMARATRWLALRSAQEKSKRRLATKAMKWAQRAIDLRPGRVEGHFYYMMAVGEYGSTLSIPRALYEGIGGKFEDAGLRAYAIDPDFDDGEVITALGRFYFVLPWPKRDLAKSRRFLEELRARHPETLTGRYYLAETYHALGEEDAARRELDFVMRAANVTDDPDAPQVLAGVALREWFTQ